MSTTTEKTEQSYSDFVDSFRLSVNQAISESNSEDEIADIALSKFSRLFGGSVIYIPRRDSRSRNSRNNLIRKEFTGNNAMELARKYGVSYQWICQIVKRKEG
ncbi:Mor transcription activator family protein [Avibacterium paragallinarum]|uniref:Mor transcription activator family protein n=1 Tax=Avibacterium paragallinarum TaxID=728 RepID=UPI003987730E